MSRQLQWDLLLLNFHQAARGLWANKLRTCLSALGIIIGVAAVIVMLALGNAAQNSVQHQIAMLGSTGWRSRPTHRIPAVCTRRGAPSAV